MNRRIEDTIPHQRIRIGNTYCYLHTGSEKVLSLPKNNGSVINSIDLGPKPLLGQLSCDTLYPGVSIVYIEANLRQGAPWRDHRQTAQRPYLISFSIDWEATAEVSRCQELRDLLRSWIS